MDSITSLLNKAVSGLYRLETADDFEINMSYYLTRPVDGVPCKVCLAGAWAVHSEKFEPPIDTPGSPLTSKKLSDRQEAAIELIDACREFLEYGAIRTSYLSMRMIDYYEEAGFDDKLLKENKSLIESEFDRFLNEITPVEYAEDRKSFLDNCERLIAFFRNKQL